MDDLKNSLRKTLLLSAGLFFIGQKKVTELIEDLQENGLNKEEAEKTAKEILSHAKEHKDKFIEKITSEIEKQNILATKEDLAKIQKTLREISKKLEE